MVYAVSACRAWLATLLAGNGGAVHRSAGQAVARPLLSFSACRRCSTDDDGCVETDDVRVAIDIAYPGRLSLVKDALLVFMIDLVLWPRAAPRHTFGPITPLVVRDRQRVRTLAVRGNTAAAPC